MTASLGPAMGVRSRLEAWLEDILPYTDRARAARRERRFVRQIQRSRKVQAEASVAITESRRAHREHMRGSYERADERLARR